MNDLDIYLSAIQAGDAVAFGRWVAGSELRVRASLASFAAQVDVEAVVQETLLRVWQVAPRLEPDGRPEMLVRFSVRVARNIAISELRRRGSSEARLLETEPAEMGAPPPEPDPMLRELIRTCRDKLPAQPALALAQRLESPELGDHRLASRVGMQRNTFLQNITRARKLLIACLERAGVELHEVLL